MSSATERVRAEGKRGEALLDRNLGKNRKLGPLLIELMRVLLLPRQRTLAERRSEPAVPRLLNMIVPGFDEDAETQHPGFRLPAALLLPISIRGPLLAGLHRVVVQPERWIEPLLGKAAKPTQRRVWNCLSAVSLAATLQLDVVAGEGRGPYRTARRSRISGNADRYPASILNINGRGLQET